MHTECSKYFISGEFPESKSISVDNWKLHWQGWWFFFSCASHPFPCLFPWNMMSFIQPNSLVQFGGWDCCGSGCCVDPASPFRFERAGSVLCLHLSCQETESPGGSPDSAHCWKSLNYLGNIEIRLWVLIKKKNVKGWSSLFSPSLLCSQKC